MLISMRSGEEKLPERLQVLEESLLVKQQCGLPRQVPLMQSFTPVTCKKMEISSRDQSKIYQIFPWQCRIPHICPRFVPFTKAIISHVFAAPVYSSCTFLLWFSRYKQKYSAVEIPSLGCSRCKKLARNQEETGQVCKKSLYRKCKESTPVLERFSILLINIWGTDQSWNHTHML